MTKILLTDDELTHFEDVRADARMALFRAVRRAFKQTGQESRLLAKDLAERIGRDPGYVSRVLKGQTSGVTAETAALFLDAMGYHLKIEEVRKSDLSRSNYDARPSTAGAATGKHSASYHSATSQIAPQTKSSPIKFNVKTELANER